MKKILLVAITVTVLAVTFSSCSMEKRHYMKGYYIDRNSHKEITASPSAQPAVENSAIAEKQQETAPVKISEPVNTTITAQPALVKKNSTASRKKAVKKLSAQMNNNVVISNPAPAAHPGVLNKRNQTTVEKTGGDISTNTLLLVILAILLPWLAVLLKEGGITTNFWIALLLWLLFILPGVIFALIIVLR